MIPEHEAQPLRLKTYIVPQPAPAQVPVKVLCSGVCRTDLHIADGNLKQPALYLIPGMKLLAGS